MSRIILTAGKGGVGKSTLAAATAAVSADRGLRTLVMSIDSAHNLSDLFALPLGHHPTPIQGRLCGLEVDLNRELTENWHAVTDFFRTMTANNPRVNQLVAEECAVLPGMEEVFGLMRLQTVVETGEWDVIVVDAPPTGDLLKFLRLPDVLHWFMEKYHPLERGMLQRIRPVADALNWPVPTEDSMEEMEYWYSRVGDASSTLTDSTRVSVRLVTTPDRVGQAETRRALTWTNLLGMNVDGLVVNRILPPGDYPDPVGAWASRQGRILAEIESEFSPLPVLRAPLQADEVIGHAALLQFGEAVLAGRDPAALWSRDPLVQWNEEADGAGTLRLRLPFLKRGQFRLLAEDGGLVLHVANQRRHIPLPLAMQRRQMVRASYDEGWLNISYDRPPAL